MPVPLLSFPRGGHYAFFFEDTHLFYLVFERDLKRYLFLVQEADGKSLALDHPGDLFESQVREAVDRVFFALLQEEGEAAKDLVLGAYFPVDGEWYGAYYERGTDEQVLFFLRIVGSGETSTLEAVEQGDEHKMIASAFSNRYRDVLSVQ